MGPFLCQNCKHELELKFQEVKKYVQENARTGIREVSEACDVSASQIQQWIREERLIFSEASPIELGCERCGKSIRTGKFCAQCKNNLSNALKESIGSTSNTKVDQDRAKMRYRDQE